MSKTAELWNSYTADTSKKNRFMSRMFVHCVRLVLGTHCGRLVPWCTKRSSVPCVHTAEACEKMLHWSSRREL